jgi:hypothetical protein
MRYCYRESVIAQSPHISDDPVELIAYLKKPGLRVIP